MAESLLGEVLVLNQSAGPGFWGGTILVGEYGQDRQ